METDMIREYLKVLASVISDRVNGAEIQESEEGPLLICSAGSPFGTQEDIGYRFSLAPGDDGLLILEIMIFLFNGIDNERSADINALINRMNAYIVLGSLRFFEDSGSVIFSQGSLLYDSLGMSEITNIIGKTLGIMENTAFNAGEYVLRCINGEKLETVLEDIEAED